MVDDIDEFPRALLQFFLFQARNEITITPVVGMDIMVKPKEVRPTNFSSGMKPFTLSLSAGGGRAGRRHRPPGYRRERVVGRPQPRHGFGRRRRDPAVPGMQPEAGSVRLRRLRQPVVLQSRLSGQLQASFQLITYSGI